MPMEPEDQVKKSVSYYVIEVWNDAQSIFVIIGKRQTSSERRNVS